MIKKRKEMKLPAFKNQGIRQNSLNSLDVLGNRRFGLTGPVFCGTMTPPAPRGTVGAMPFERPGSAVGPSPHPASFTRFWQQLGPPMGT